MNSTPRGIRVNIGVFGNVNAGKSTFVNAVTGRSTAITSPVAGTTTDPVYKTMELLPIGPVVFIDTAGLNDETVLGEKRKEKTIEVMKSCDMAVFVLSEGDKIPDECPKNIPVLIVENLRNNEPYSENIPKIRLNLLSENAGDILRNAVIKAYGTPADLSPELTGNLVKSGDIALLVAPQDIQAPKGRLILPEVQTIRDLLDNKCIVMMTSADKLEAALNGLSRLPDLVVTDSQVFPQVNAVLPKAVPLTSFSLLMAKIKGDLPKLIKGAETISRLENGDKVLIVESCTHHPMEGDIAREKLPKLLRKFTGKELVIDVISGCPDPRTLSGYRLAVHCGGCMLNRRAMLSRQADFENSGVPLTNFGAAIAYMNGMLDRVCY
ncbi:MAG: [FeFe] hydrogenase H-cluster maturation GTPase HydF [Oscillospiraceae bacterium]|nr:[FeFe] hydrogenase H-cluster maturation GTPase HydF [Oscillospiraceae bacterium]